MFLDKKRMDLPLIVLYFCVLKFDYVNYILYAIHYGKGYDRIVHFNVIEITNSITVQSKLNNVSWSSNLPNIASVVTSSITNGSIASTTSYVYYAQEFVGNNYNSDSNFLNFAMADIYESINEYSSLSYFNVNEAFDEVDYGNIKLLLPKNINGTVGSYTAVDGVSRFALKEFDNSAIC